MRKISSRTEVDDPRSVGAPPRRKPDMLHIKRVWVGPMDELILSDVTSVTDSNDAIFPRNPEIPVKDESGSNVYRRQIIGKNVLCEEVNLN